MQTFTERAAKALNIKPVYILVMMIMIGNLIILKIPFHLVFTLWLPAGISKDISNTIHGMLTVAFCIKMGLIFQVKIGRFFHPFKISNWQFLLIPFVFPLLLSIPNFSNVSLSDFFVPSAVISCFTLLMLGLAEETMFRGFVLSALLVESGKGKLLRSVLISSALFSCMHLVNFWKFNAIEILVQMIIAFNFGVFFSAIVLKTKNLLYPGIIHGIVNICFDVDSVLNRPSSKQYIDSWQEVLLSITTTSLIFSPMFLIGWIIIKKMNGRDRRAMMSVPGISSSIQNSEHVNFRFPRRKDENWYE